MTGNILPHHSGEQVFTKHDSCNSISWEAEASGLPELHRKTLSPISSHPKKVVSESFLIVDIVQFDLLVIWLASIYIVWMMNIKMTRKILPCIHV